MKLVIRLVISALATALAVWLVPGIHLTASSDGEKALTLIVVAAIFGLVNAVVRPLITIAGACLILLTMGLFLFVINALMLMLTAWLAGSLGFGFEVDGFWWAVLGSIIISLATSLISGLIETRD
ncbi:phage holin family protein [Tessaracoccus antarcticus]|uniref:Phage holin family protein n=1 Tax=Tessaracoccus antarcticus TaxID=2479848 RepID=A0A3M0FZ85_9ACTN|nr:phage holin family protein [Tessaracoccus antarcticus]RMB57815.1 phage holin family protein [Tessaracoccus antarcticus]